MIRRMGDFFEITGVKTITISLSKKGASSCPAGTPFFQYAAGFR